MREQTDAIKVHCQEVRQVTLLSLFANASLALFKFIAGYWGNSRAVLADAVHTLSDMSTDIAILVGVNIWTKPADDTHPYGHLRIETMVTLSMSIILTLVATGLLFNAITRLHTGHTVRPEWIALVAALVSIVSKEILYHWTLRVGKRIKSMPVIANAWHQRSDALSSFPAAVAVAGAMIHPEWAFLDLVGECVVSLLIFQAALKIGKPAFDKLIDAATHQKEVEKIEKIAVATPGVKIVHEIRTRYIGSFSLAVDLHVLVDSQLTVEKGHAISEEVKKRLLDLDQEIIDVVVHLEPY